jgi:hypothetical protein
MEDVLGLVNGLGDSECLGFLHWHAGNLPEDN